MKSAGRSGSNRIHDPVAARPDDRAVERDPAIYAGAGGPGPADGGDRNPALNVYSLLFEQMSTAVVLAETLFDASGNPVDYCILDVNPAFEKLTGIKAEQMNGKLAFELRPNLKPRLVEQVARVALTGEPAEIAVDDRPSDRAVVIRISRAGPSRIVVLIDDVTQARRAEAAIRERTAYAETIIASLAEGLVVFDQQLRYAVWNPVMERIMGRPASEVIGRRPPDATPELVTPGIREVLQGVLAGESPTTLEIKYRAEPTGISGWVTATYRPHRNSLGEIVGVVATYRDVTPEHVATEALRRSEEQFRAIFDNVGDAVAIHEPGKTFVEANRVLSERLGYTREELLAMPVAAINAPELRETIAERSAQIMREGSSVFETVHVRRDGVRFPVEVSARRIEFQGRPAILSVQRDISERKRTEEAMQQQATFLQQILDAIPIPIIAKDRDGRVTLANAEFVRGTGSSATATVGRKMPELGIEDADVHAAVDAAVMTDGLVHTHEGQVAAVGGGTSHLMFTKAPLRAADGTITGVIAAAIDMTDRVAVEQSLRRSEERFRALFENAADAIFMWDPAGKFIEVNQAACDRLGYSREELLAMKPEAIDPADMAPLSEERTQRLRSDGSVYFEAVHLRKDGTTFPVEMSLTTLDMGGRVAVLGISRDISDRRQAETDRAALEEQLRQAQKMEGIGQLAGGIAHDFNNLLTAIRGYATLALRDAAPNEVLRGDLEQIEHAADRAAGLTRQLLAFARRTVLQPEQLDLGKIVRSIEPMLTRLLGEDVSLTTITPRARGLALADPNQMEQVIVNLAVNARDAMPDGGQITIKTGDVDLDDEFVRQNPAATPGPNSMLAVTDTGTGMDSATMAHLFEPFFTTKGPGKGTGLGLATVYGIVRQSGGVVVARSEFGQGSTFTVYLPHTAPESQEPAGKPAVAESPRVKQTATILVVEDDGGVRGFVTTVLERAGHHVISAAGAAEAFELARHKTIGLLLTDVVMPNMSGRDVAARLSATRPGLRVLYMSGHAEHAIVRHGVLEPGINFIAKPFAAEALLAAVENVMSRSGAE